MSTTSPTTISDIRTIAVHVTDLDAAIGFYVGTLGFEIRLDVQATPTMRWVEVAAAGADVTLALVAGRVGREPTDTGIRFAVLDAAREHAELDRKGVVVGDLLVWDGVPPMFTFDDVDSNRFTIVETVK